MGNINMFFKFIANQFHSYRNEKSKEKKLSHYYTNVKNDARSNTAKVLDFAIWRMMFFFMTFFLLYIQTFRLILSVGITVMALLIVHQLSLRARNTRMENMKEKKRRYVASQKVYMELLDKTTEELKEYMESLCSKIGFKPLSCIRSDHRQILLKAMYSGDEYMLLLNVYRGEHSVELKDIKEFLCELIEHGSKRGLVITTTDFTEGALSYSKQLNENYKLVLLDKDQFLNLIESQGMFPQNDEIDELIMNKISKKEKRWTKYKKSLLSEKKSKGYFWLSLYIILAAYYTPYTYYYILVGFVTLLLAGVTAVSNFKNKENKDEEKWVDFEKILKD